MPVVRSSWSSVGSFPDTTDQSRLPRTVVKESEYAAPTVAAGTPTLSRNSRCDCFGVHQGADGGS